MATPRKSTDERLEAARKRQETIRNKVAVLEARKRAEQRRRETRRTFIVGAAALVQADADPAFREVLRSALESAVTRPADRVLIADLLGVEVPATPLRAASRSKAA